MKERRKNNLIGAAYGAGATIGVYFAVVSPSIARHGKENGQQINETTTQVRKLIVSQEYPSRADIKGIYEKSLELTNLDLMTETEGKLDDISLKLENFLGTYSEEKANEQDYGRAILVDTRDQLFEARLTEEFSTKNVAGNGFWLGVVMLGICGYNAVKRIYCRKPKKKPSPEPTTS